MIYRAKNLQEAEELAIWLEDNEFSHTMLESIPSPTSFKPIPIRISIDDEKMATLFLLRWA